MNEAAPELIAIVLNYRRPSETVRCIASLKRSAGKPFRIIVVDNDSGDGSAAGIRAAHPDVELLQAARNEGYTGGMNAGIDRAMAAGPEYLLLLNSDTEVEPDFTEKLLASLRSRPRAAAASGTIRIPGEGGRAWYAGGALRPWRGSAYTAHRFPAAEEIAACAVRSVTFISGCGFLVRAEALRTAGSFDNRFFMYVEDVELFSRLRRAGYELLYVTGAMMDHHAGDESLTPARLYYSVRNRFLFVDISTRGAIGLVARCYVAATTLMKMCLWAFRDRPFVRAAWTGYRDYRDGRFHAGSGPALAMGAARGGNAGMGAPR